MENLIEIKNDYNSLDKLLDRLEKNTTYQCSKTYDIWEHRTDANGQMAQCIVIKKSNMNAAKVFFVNENTVKVNHIIPNKVMHAYFGKNVKAYRNIIEIAAGAIKNAVLAAPQKKAFEEIEKKLIRLAS
ncbi:hypothetical protein ACFO3O_06105 [Dokdonia ponticola]|uniref:Uncharacterized protein n=1 Tax=Dokdonia ponticola TaxID=2041041 RepID=A0ABV9HWS8_9FLAO